MISHLKRRISVFAAVAVMAAGVPALTTVSPASAAPATTAITVVTDDATYLTCPASASIPSAGFTDTTSTDVDCIAYYGITKGTTATTYEPTASVPRWAMALYLTRAMNEAGVTLGTGADQGFTDISGKSAEIQTAINQLKQAGVTTGTTATTYSPDDNVSRQQMAMFIERMLDTITVGPGGVSDAELVGGAATTYINSNCDAAQACTGLYNYTDIDSGAVTVEASIAIKELYQLGIHDGVSATTFNPDADMTRAAMASFLVGALDHSNLRPAGLHMQASTYSTIVATTPTLHVSYRDASFDPIVSTAVDVFRWKPTGLEGDRAFATASGLCEDAVLTTGSITACSIDANEPATDLTGNMVPTAAATAPLSQALGTAGTDNYYAWTAATATAFDNDLHSSGTTYSTIQVVGNPVVADIHCSNDVPAYAATTSDEEGTVHFGKVTTITCQATNLTDADTYTNVPAPLKVITMNRTRVNTNLGGVASSAISDAEAVTGYTDATGAVSFTVTGPADPGGGLVVGNTVKDTITLTCTGCTITQGTLPVANTGGHMTLAGEVLTLILHYKAATDAGGRVALTQTASSGLAATASITRSVTATHYDQYGDPFPASAVTFSSLNRMHEGATCTLADPGICTLTGHGLAVGDDFVVTHIGDGVSACSGDATVALGAGDVGNFTVTTVADANTFTASCSDDALQFTTASDAAGPTQIHTTSFASTARTTNAAGVATYSWADTESTSGVDEVTATPAVGTPATVDYFRLAAPADVVEIGDGNTTRADSEDNYGCVEFDAVAQTYIVVHMEDNDTSDPIYSYMKFSYDSNDQFGHTGAEAAGLDGTPTTMAAWVTSMTATCTLGNAAAFPGGIVSSIAHVDYVNGLSTDIQRHVLGAAH